MTKATRTLNPLHFEDLEPHRFEDLVRQLIYDFRDWVSIEPTGRLGSDEGIDIRAIETLASTPNELDGEEPDEEETAIKDSSNSARLWLIQCKREKKIGPSKARAIVSSNLSNQEPVPYGYILIASCDFSKATRDAFRAEVITHGVQEFHLWGKADLDYLASKAVRGADSFPWIIGHGIGRGRERSGTPLRMTPELVITLCEHAAGNHRVVMTMANELLDAAVQRGARQLDEKLYLEIFAVPPTAGRPRTKASVTR